MLRLRLAQRLVLTASAILAASPHGSAAPRPSTRVTIGVLSQVALDPPPKAFGQPLLVGSELLVDDLIAGGLLRYDVASGKLLGPIGKRGRRAGQLQAPAHATMDPQGQYYLYDRQRHHYIRLSKDRAITSEWRWSHDIPLGGLTWVDGRLIAYGQATSEESGGDWSTYLFRVDLDKRTSRGLWSDGADHRTRNIRCSVIEYGGGGVAALPDGGWVGVLPTPKFEILHFDRADHLSERWEVKEPAYRPLNLDSFPAITPGAPPKSSVAAMTGWLDEQVVPRRPHVWKGQYLLVPVSVPGKPTRHLIEVLDLKGRPLATSVPLPVEGRHLSVVSGSEDWWLVTRDEWQQPTRVVLWRLDVAIQR